MTTAWSQTQARLLPRHQSSPFAWHLEVDVAFVLAPWTPSEKRIARLINFVDQGIRLQLLSSPNGLSHAVNMACQFLLWFQIVFTLISHAFTALILQLMALWSSMVKTTPYRRRCSAAVLHWWPKQRGSLFAAIGHCSRKIVEITGNTETI